MSERLLLIVEDDAAFARTLARSFERRGYRVIAATSLDTATALMVGHRPTHAVVDLKLGQESGLAVVRHLHAHDPDLLIVVLTGFAANTDDIEAAFAGEQAEPAELPTTTRATSIKTLEMERIHQVLAETDFNISETARRLGMHRRTLARKLAKRWVS